MQTIIYMLYHILTQKSIHSINDCVNMTTNSRWYALRLMIAIHSYPSTQQITHLDLIIYGVATSITPTYNTTNTPNKLSSHHFICNVPYNETAETSAFFCSFIVDTTTSCFASK